MAKKNVGVHGTDAERSTGGNGDATQRGEVKKKVCPITREQFRDNAKPTKIIISHDGKEATLVAAPRPDGFSSGSEGWYAGEKVTLEIDGVPVQCQVGVNITVIGSKELPKE